MSHYCVFLFFIMAFDLDQGDSFPFKENGKIEKSHSFSEKYQGLDNFQKNGQHYRYEKTANKTDPIAVPEFVMDMYQTYTEVDGTLKGDKMPATIHCFIGKGRVCMFSFCKRLLHNSHDNYFFNVHHRPGFRFQ